MAANGVQRIQIGGLCPRGGSHIWTYDDDDAGACGSKSWDLFIEVEPDDFWLLPDWVKELAQEMSDG